MNDSRQYLQNIMRGYRLSQVLITCAELGVFDNLSLEGVTAEVLAEKLKVHPGGLERLLNAATAMELLKKRGQEYFPGTVALDCLVPGSPRYMTNSLKLENAVYRRWARLREAVETGTRPEENRREEHNPNWVRDFELALLDTARITGPFIADMLGPILEHRTHRPVRVIDVGGGHGGYCIALAEKYPYLEATVFELPAAAEVAREVTGASSVANRIGVEAGDFRTDSLGSGYDMALLFGVLVSEPDESAIALLKKVNEALLPGGVVVIRGFYLNAERSGPPDATLFDLHMLLSNSSGGAKTLDEVTGWLEEAGFRSFETVDFPPPERSSLLIAHKSSISAVK